MPDMADVEEVVEAAPEKRAPVKVRRVVSEESATHAALDMAQKALTKAERVEARLAEKEGEPVKAAPPSKEKPKPSFWDDALELFQDDDDEEKAEDESDA